MKKEKYEITIIVDTNDADFATAVNEISNKELEKLRFLFDAIKKFKPYKNKGHQHHYNFPVGECLREDLGEKPPQELYDIDDDLFELFSEYCPFNEYGFHTIESVEICPLRMKEKLV